MTETMKPPNSVFNQVPKKKRVFKPRPPIDVASIKVERNVPIPVASRGPGAVNQWQPLLDKLQHPNTASAPVPIEYRHSLKNAAEKHFKAKGGKFTLRVVSDTHIRIWRTE